MALKQIEVLGSQTKSISDFESVQQRQNCFYEINADGEKGTKFYIRATPGTVAVAELPEQNYRGHCNLALNTYILAGFNLYRQAPDNTITTLGSPLDSNTGLASLSTNGTQILICTGGSAYIYDIAGDTMTQVISPGFPVGATSCAYTNGFFIAPLPDSQQFFISSFNDGLTWDPLDNDYASVTPDNILAVDVLHGTVIFWGISSIEFWQDVGNESFPFSQLTGTAQDFGLAAINSRAAINNTLCFLASNLQGQVQVMYLDGYSPTRISDESIENIINEFRVVGDAVAFAYSLGGHPFYQLTFPNAQRTFLYDFRSKIWSTLKTGTDASGPHFAKFGWATNNKYFVNSGAGGTIYQYLFNVNTDNGSTIQRQITSKHIQVDGNVFTVDELWIDLETGGAPLTGIGSDPLLIIEVSKDDGHTFYLHEQVTMGKQGQYLYPRCISRRFGSARDLVIRLTCSEPVPFVITRVCANITYTNQ